MSCEDVHEALLFACAALATHAHSGARRCGGLTTRAGCAIHKVHMWRRLLLRCIGTWGIIRARPGTGAGNSLRGGFKPNTSNKAFRSPGRTTASHRWSPPIRWSSSRSGGGTSQPIVAPRLQPGCPKSKDPASSSDERRVCKICDEILLGGHLCRCARVSPGFSIEALAACMRAAALAR